MVKCACNASFQLTYTTFSARVQQRLADRLCGYELLIAPYLNLPSDYGAVTVLTYHMSLHCYKLSMLTTQLCVSKQSAGSQSVPTAATAALKYDFPVCGQLT